ncbi:MAG TPA: META domain-containing protein, partial [Quisquiliibacterium sp.]|nr:META domain-containing protein [Quisquiliibacterium sp.]
MRKYHLSILGGALALLAGCTIPFESLLPGGPPSAAHPVEAQAAASAAPGATAEVSFDALMGSDWIVDDPAFIARDGGRTPTLRFLDGDRVSGTGGCNRFSGQASVSRGVAHLGPVAATRMACRGSVADTEARFFQALEAVRGARLEGIRLVLLDGAGKPLVRFVRADPGSAAGDATPAGGAGASAGAPAGPNLAEAAAARGVTFLGRGNEPGWRLEIGPGDLVRVVYDYGMARADFP